MTGVWFRLCRFLVIAYLYSLSVLIVTLSGHFIEFKVRQDICNYTNLKGQHKLSIFRKYKISFLKHLMNLLDKALYSNEDQFKGQSCATYGIFFSECDGIGSHRRIDKVRI